MFETSIHLKSFRQKPWTGLRSGLRSGLVLGLFLHLRRKLLLRLVGCKTWFYLLPKIKGQDVLIQKQTLDPFFYHADDSGLSFHRYWMKVGDRVPVINTHCTSAYVIVHTKKRLGKNLFQPYKAFKNMLLCALFEFLCGYKSFIGIGGFLLGFRGHLWGPRPISRLLSWILYRAQPFCSY